MRRVPRASDSRHAQTALEFLVLLGVMIIVFASFFVVAQGIIVEQREKNLNEALAEVATAVEQEFLLASQVHDGYSRVFELPTTVAGQELAVEIMDGKELVLSSGAREYIRFLPVTVLVDGSEDGVLGEQNYITKDEGGINIIVLDMVCGDGSCENGESCTSCPLDCGECPSVCGNSDVEDGEECDDGDTILNACEYGVACTVCGPDCTKVPGITSFCGDGIWDTSNEGCDDGNTVTEECAYGETSCTVCAADCTEQAGVTSYCGDGRCDAENEGCGACEADCPDQLTPFYQDLDGDGYGNATEFVETCEATHDYNATVAGDCDDTNAAINPDAPELCDGIDNDCDAGTADGADEAWLNQLCDGDKDTDLCLEGTYSCVAGEQYCSDETESTVEICNGYNDDCDYQFDEGCNQDGSDSNTDYAYNPEMVCNGSFWAYGGPGQKVAMQVACDEQGPDCNDSDPTIHPGQAETCGDIIDNNCDGVNTLYVYENDYNDDKKLDETDRDLLQTAVASRECSYPNKVCDLTSDGELTPADIVAFMQQLASCCPDADGDGHYVIAEGCLFTDDCDDSNQYVYINAPELCDGIDNDCDAGTADGADESWYGTPCDGSDGDSCMEGSYSCVAGEQYCSDWSGTTDEVCSNNIDDDCDDVTDEDGFFNPCCGTSQHSCCTQDLTGGSGGCAYNLKCCNGVCISEGSFCTKP